MFVIIFLIQHISGATLFADTWVCLGLPGLPGAWQHLQSFCEEEAGVEKVILSEMSLTWKRWMESQSRGPGIEGKGCKILSRLSLSVGSQLEVSSAHSVPGSALQHWDRCHCLCSRVTDCLTLWGQAWLNLNGITASSRGRAVQIHCSAIHVTLTAGLKTDWHCTHGFSTSVQSGLERVFGYVKLFINFLSFCWRG